MQNARTRAYITILQQTCVRARACMHSDLPKNITVILIFSKRLLFESSEHLVHIIIISRITPLRQHPRTALPATSRPSTRGRANTKRTKTVCLCKYRTRHRNTYTCARTRVIWLRTVMCNVTRRNGCFCSSYHIVSLVRLRSVSQPGIQPTQHYLVRTKRTHFPQPVSSSDACVYRPSL